MEHREVRIPSSSIPGDMQASAPIVTAASKQMTQMAMEAAEAEAEAEVLEEPEEEEHAGQFIMNPFNSFHFNDDSDDDESFGVCCNTMSMNASFEHDC